MLLMSAHAHAHAHTHAAAASGIWLRLHGWEGILVLLQLCDAVDELPACNSEVHGTSFHHRCLLAHLAIPRVLENLQLHVPHLHLGIFQRDFPRVGVLEIVHLLRLQANQRFASLRECGHVVRRRVVQNLQVEQVPPARTLVHLHAPLASPLAVALVGQLLVALLAPLRDRRASRIHQATII